MCIKLQVNFHHLTGILSAFATAASGPITAGLVWLRATAAGITHSGHPELRSPGQRWMSRYKFLEIWTATVRALRMIRWNVHQQFTDFSTIFTVIIKQWHWFPPFYFFKRGWFFWSSTYEYMLKKYGFCPQKSRFFQPKWDIFKKSWKLFRAFEFSWS